MRDLAERENVSRASTSGHISTLVLLLTLAMLFCVYFFFFHCGPTRYAPGFTEAKFASLHEGMSPGEVLAIVGPPLKKYPEKDGYTAWYYSNRDNECCDHERRALGFQGGKLTHIVNDHWKNDPTPRRQASALSRFGLPRPKSDRALPLGLPATNLAAG